MVQLTPEDEQYFFDLTMLFVTPGWHQFKKDFEAFHAALKEDVLSLRTMEEFHFARGRADAFRQIATYEEMVTENKKALDAAIAEQQLEE